MYKRTKKILAALQDEIGSTAKPITTQGYMFRIKGKRVHIRSANLVTVRRTYQDKKYEYKVWHLNFYPTAGELKFDYTYYGLFEKNVLIGIVKLSAKDCTKHIVISRDRWPLLSIGDAVYVFNA